MTGQRKYARPGGPGYTYYRCPHDPANPRHAATAPDHPTIAVREDLMTACVAEFFDTRIFGPDRAALLAAALPAEAAGAARQRDTETAAMQQRIRQIDAAENSHAREIEALAHEDPNSPAVTAYRRRILARFAELEGERAAITARIAQLTAAPPPPATPHYSTSSPASPASSTTPPSACSSSCTTLSASSSCTTPKTTRSAATPPSPPPPPKPSQPSSPAANPPHPPPAPPPQPPKWPIP